MWSTRRFFRRNCLKPSRVTTCVDEVLSYFRPRTAFRALGATTWLIPNLKTGREQLGNWGERGLEA